MAKVFLPAKAWSKFLAGLGLDEHYVAKGIEVSLRDDNVARVNLTVFLTKDNLKDLIDEWPE